MVAYLGGIAERLNRRGGCGVIEQVEFVQRPIGHTQRVFHRRRAARHGKVGEVREPLEIGSICEQNLAAPNTPVVTVARAIEGDANGRLVEAAFGHGAYDVRVMVLDFLKGQLFACVGCAAMGLFGPFRRGIRGACQPQGFRARLGTGFRNALLPKATRRTSRRFPCRQYAGSRTPRRRAAGRTYSFCSGPAANSTRFVWLLVWSPFFASEIGMGANPRARRTICTASPALPAEITRTTESSKRQRMGRLLPRNASAMLASWERASSSVMQMGSSQIARRHDEWSAERGKQQVLHRRIRQHNPSSGRWSARPAANFASSCFFKSTMGRCVPASKRRSASLT